LASYIPTIRQGAAIMTITPAEHDAAGDGAEKTPVQARQGVTTGHMRWVLRISLVLGVLALGGVFFGFIAMQHRPGHGDTTTPPAAAAPAHAPAAS
jgi:hypothetical protein